MSHSLRTSFRSTVVILLTVALYDATVFAGDVRTWNLSRDIQSGINKNPSGVWAYMQKNSGGSNPAYYTLLPDFWKSTDPWGNPMTVWNNNVEQGYIGVPLRNFTWGNTIKATKGVTHMHPGPSNQAILRWKSPINGTVNILGRITDVDPGCGNGINWSLNKHTNVLQSGHLDGNGALINVQNVPVLTGNPIYLVVDSADGNHCGDTTNVDLLIAGNEIETTTVVTTDATWKVSRTEIAGWNDVGFDDSSWNAAVTDSGISCGWAEYDLGSGKTAPTIWNAGHSYGVYLRKSIVLSREVISANVISFSDDDHRLYINGQQVYVEMDGTAGPVMSVDITSHLRTGENVIAYYAQDTFGGCAGMGGRFEITTRQ